MGGSSPSPPPGCQCGPQLDQIKGDVTANTAELGKLNAQFNSNLSDAIINAITSDGSVNTTIQGEVDKKMGNYVLQTALDNLIRANDDKVVIGSQEGITSIQLGVDDTAPLNLVSGNISAANVRAMDTLQANKKIALINPNVDGKGNPYSNFSITPQGYDTVFTIGDGYNNLTVEGSTMALATQKPTDGKPSSGNLSVQGNITGPSFETPTFENITVKNTVTVGSDADDTPPNLQGTINVGNGDTTGRIFAGRCCNV